MKKLIELSIEGAKVLDLCIEGDKLIEQGTGGVYNKSVKGVKVNKGEFRIRVFHPYTILLRPQPSPRFGFSDQFFRQQCRRTLFTSCVCLICQMFHNSDIKLVPFLFTFWAAPMRSLHRHSLNMMSSKSRSAPRSTVSQPLVRRPLL